jgi:hypothetical protein
MPIPSPKPSATDQPISEKASVRARRYRESATTPVSGTSSWKLVSEKTTNGAVASRKAASSPASVSSSRRPSRKTLAAPRARKPSITA